MGKFEKHRQKAKDIYLHLYDQNTTHGRCHYGGKNWGNGTYDYVKELGITSLVDVGCGRNDFVKWAVSQGINAVGVDIACPLADFVCSANALPFKDKEFEYITSFDVMEHLIPEEIDDTLDEFFRVASEGFLFAISYKQSHNEIFGQDLHFTVKEKKWWLSKLSQYGKVNLYRGMVDIKDRKGNTREQSIKEYIHCVLHDTKAETQDCNAIRESGQQFIETRYFLGDKEVDIITNQEVQN